MTEATMGDLQESVQDKSAFNTLDDYSTICKEFLVSMKRTHPTRIVSPSHANYIFYQYGEDYGNKITRPLNINLFIESAADFKNSFEKFVALLADLKDHQQAAVRKKTGKSM